MFFQLSVVTIQGVGKVRLIQAWYGKPTANVEFLLCDGRELFNDETADGRGGEGGAGCLSVALAVRLYDCNELSLTSRAQRVALEALV